METNETLQNRARRLGLGLQALVTASGLTKATVWRALKDNRFPLRNGNALKLALALGWTEVPDQKSIGPVTEAPNAN